MCTREAWAGAHVGSVRGRTRGECGSKRDKRSLDKRRGDVRCAEESRVTYFANTVSEASLLVQGGLDRSVRFKLLLAPRLLPTMLLLRCLGHCVRCVGGISGEDGHGGHRHEREHRSSPDGPRQWLKREREQAEDGKRHNSKEAKKSDEADNLIHSGCHTGLSLSRALRSASIRSVSARTERQRHIASNAGSGWRVAPPRHPTCVQ